MVLVLSLTDLWNTRERGWKMLWTEKEFFRFCLTLELLFFRRLFGPLRAMMALNELRLTLASSRIIHLKERESTPGPMVLPILVVGTQESFFPLPSSPYLSISISWCFYRMHGKGIYVSEKGEQWQGAFYNGAGPELVRPVLTPTSKTD